MTGLALFGFAICIALGIVFVIFALGFIINGFDTESGPELGIGLVFAVLAAAFIAGAVQVKRDYDAKQRVDFEVSAPGVELHFPIENKNPKSNLRIDAPRLPRNETPINQIVDYRYRAPVLYPNYYRRTYIYRPQLPPIDRYINPRNFHRRFDDNDPRPIYRYENVPAFDPYFNPYELPENRVTPVAHEITGEEVDEFLEEKPMRYYEHDLLNELVKVNHDLATEIKRLEGEVKALAADCLEVYARYQTVHAELDAKTSALKRASQIIAQQQRLLRRHRIGCH